MKKLIKALASEYNLDYTNTNGVLAVRGQSNTIRKTKTGIRWITDIKGGDEYTILNAMSSLSPGPRFLGALTSVFKKNKPYNAKDGPSFATFEIPEDFKYEGVHPVVLNVLTVDKSFDIFIHPDGKYIHQINARPMRGTKNFNDNIMKTLEGYMYETLGMDAKTAEGKPLISIFDGKNLHVCVYIFLMDTGDVAIEKDGDWFNFEDLDVDKLKGIDVHIMEEFFQKIRPFTKEEVKEQCDKIDEKVLQE